jgi:hypothetical protein
LISFTLIVWVLSSSNPANFTTAGFEPKTPLEPTISKLSFKIRTGEWLTLGQQLVGLLGFGLADQVALHLHLFGRLALLKGFFHD